MMKKNGGGKNCFCGKPVIPPEQLKLWPDADILITSVYKYEIIEQLIHIGIDLTRIFFILPEWMKEICSSVRICSEGIELSIKETRLILHSSLEEMICREIWSEEQYNVNMQWDSIVLDIGLNVGLATLFFANKRFVKKIYAFEPDQRVYQKALTNIGLNHQFGNLIEVYNVACSSSDRIERYINTPSTSTGIRKRRTSDLPDCDTVEIKCVDSAVVLGEIINRHFGKEKIILKCDCEGAEYEIFDRLEETGYLEKIDVIVMEWHIGRRNEIEQKLSGNGFIYFINTTPGTTFGKCYAIKSN